MFQKDLAPQSSRNLAKNKLLETHFSSAMSNNSKQSNQSKKPNKVRIIPWYFYPECAEKSIFKSKTALIDFNSVLKDFSVSKVEKAEKVLVRSNTAREITDSGQKRK